MTISISSKIIICEYLKSFTFVALLSWLRQDFARTKFSSQMLLSEWCPVSYLCWLTKNEIESSIFFFWGSVSPSCLISHPLLSVVVLSPLPYQSCIPWSIQGKHGLYHVSFFIYTIYHIVTFSFLDNVASRLLRLKISNPDEAHLVQTQESECFEYYVGCSFYIIDILRW